MDASLFAVTALLVTAACLASTALVLHLQNRRKIVRLRSAHRRTNSHIQKSRMELMEVRNRARVLEDTVKHGTGAVEKMHQAIATTTFSLIDHFSTDASFRERATRARDNHESSSHRVYQTVRTTNKVLHLLADALIISRKEKKLTRRTRSNNLRKPHRNGQ